MAGAQAKAQALAAAGGRDAAAGRRRGRLRRAVDDLMGLSGMAPALFAPALRIATRLPQHSITTVITNLPGPSVPLYALGRRMLHMYPYLPLGGRMRIGVAVMSYLGVLHFGFTGDHDSTADLDVLRRGVGGGLTELLEAVPD